MPNQGWTVKAKLVIEGPVRWSALRVAFLAGASLAVLCGAFTPALAPTEYHTWCAAIWREQGERNVESEKKQDKVDTRGIEWSY